MKKLTLDVAISTYKPEGIKRVEQMLQTLSPREGVRYIVSWQQHEDKEVPETIQLREDVEVIRLDQKGLSNNRNNAINFASADIVLIADDDLEYDKDFVDKVLGAFEKDDDLDFALFKIRFKNEKEYPIEDCDLKIPFPKNYYVTSMEIAFRRKKSGDLRFYPEMGLGAELMHCGEEELFVFSAIKRGHKVKFFNREIASHPSETTGEKVSDSILRAQGFIISLMYPFSFFLRLPLKAWRLKKHKNTPFFSALCNLASGAVHQKLIYKKIPSCYR